MACTTQLRMRNDMYLDEFRCDRNDLVLIAFLGCKQTIIYQRCPYGELVEGNCIEAQTKEWMYNQNFCLPYVEQRPAIFIRIERVRKT